MKRRAVLSGVAVLAGAALFPAAAQQARRVARIGFLALGDPHDFRLLGVRRGLQALGYLEGQDFVLYARFGERGRYEQLDGLAAELVHEQADVIIAALNPDIAAAKRATSSIPIVMAVSGDPVGQGFVRTLARPGTNVTGLAWALSHEIEEKSVEVLAELVPQLTRVAALMDAGYELTDVYWDSAERAAKTRSLAFQRYRIRKPDEFEQVFGAMRRDGVGAVMVGGGRLLNEQELMVKLAALGIRHQLAVHYKWRGGAEAGALVSYGPDLLAFYERTAIYVDRILRGARPQNLPIEHPTRFELVVNLKTAKALGIAVPQSVLLRAAAAIE